MRSPGTGTVTLEVPDHLVVPGFIDLHLHGAAGAAVMEASKAGLMRIARFLAAHGTTGFLATTLSASPREAVALCRAVRELQDVRTGGARVLGVHLEGPYLNPRYAGAHPRERLRAPNVAKVEELLTQEPQAIKMVTLAPERKGAPEVIGLLRSRGVVVAAGHSGATYEQAGQALQLGVRHITHLFNAMRAWHHREPGLAGAVFSDSVAPLSFELIADGHHLHPVTVTMTLLAAKALPVLVSDALPVLGLSEGRYRVAEQEIMVEGETARLPDGRLAGSLLTLDRALRNVARWLNRPLPELIPLATVNPARVLGLQSQLGELLPGRRADLVVLDAEGKVCLTMVGGEVVYSLPEFDRSWR